MKNLKFLKDRLIAHRGLYNNKNIPENSIKAFEKSIKNGMTIELDVHLLKDNTIVVFHDDNLKRMTGIDKKIKDMNYDELNKLYLLDTNFKIPTLKEVLDIIDGKVPVIIELKYDVKNHKLEKELVKILDLYKGQFAIKSFNPFIIKWFKKNRPNYIRGLLVSDKKDTFSKYLNNKMFFLSICKPDFLSVNKKMLNNQKIKKFKKEKPVIAWTIKGKEELNKYKDSFDNLICENI